MIGTLVGALLTLGPFGKEIPTNHKEVDGRIVIYAQQDLFASFNSSSEVPPYVYPLFNHDQVPLTRNYPMREGFANEETDHPHHRSNWFAHGAINGVDFWHGVGTYKTTAQKARTNKNQTVIEYKGDLLHEGKPLATTSYEITFSAWEIARAVDWKVTLTPAPGVDQITFGDTKEGTMAIRTRPELRLNGEHAKGNAINSEGVQGVDCWGKRAKWVSYWAPVEGKDIGLAVFDSPTNHAHPTWWMARDYGLIGANPFGQSFFEDVPAGTGDLTVKAGDSLTLTYRFLFFEGKSDPRTLDRIYNDWAKQTLASQTKTRAN